MVVPEAPLSAPAASSTTLVPLGLERAAAVAWRLLIIVLAVAAAAAILTELRVVVIPLIVAVLVATVLLPPARWLRNRGMPAGPAAMIVLAAAVAILAVAIIFIGTQVASEFDNLGDQVSDATDEIEDWLVSGPLDLERSQVDEWRETLSDSLDDNSDAITQGAVQAGTIVVEVVAGIALAFVLTFFILKDGRRFRPWLHQIFSTERATDLWSLTERIWTTLAGYVRGVAITGIVDGAIIGLGLVLLGVPLAVPLGVITVAAAFIPLVGATVAGALAAAVALVANGPGTALAVVALTLVVQQVEGDVLAPLVLGRAVRLHPATILIALTAGSVLAGIIGAFLGVPIAAVGKAIFEHYHRPPDRIVPTDSTGIPSSAPGQPI